MKKIIRKNQIIITALAVMVAVAGYLNFSGRKLNQGNIVSTSIHQEKNGKNKTNGKKISKKTKTGTNATTTTDISAEDELEKGYQVGDNGEIKISTKENPGEAVSVSNTLTSNYFASARLSREQNRAKNEESLTGIVNNKSIASKDKKAAIDQLAELSKISEKENAAELMLRAKGFEEAIVCLDHDTADVVVSAKQLTEQQIAQVQDIVKRKTGMAAENIVITPVSVHSKKAALKKGK